MNAKRLRLAAVALITVIGLGVGWKNSRAARAAASAVAATARHQTRVETDLRQVAERLAAAEKDRHALQSQLDELQKPKRGAASASAPPTVTLTDTERAIKAGLEKMMRSREDPNVQNRALASIRVNLATRYAFLFRALGLSAPQTEKFLDLALQRQAQIGDIFAVARAKGMAVNDPVVGKLVGQMQLEYEAAQRELLGEAGYRQLQDYERTAQMRNLVSSMAGVATVAGSPFTPQQAEQLVQVLANANSRYRSGGEAFVQNVDWAAVEAPARTILSEAQYACLQLSSRRLSRQVDDLISQAVKTDAASAAAPAAKASGG
jgi:hypothetical protein